MNIAAAYDYDEAFARNRGLIAPAEQQRLRETCVLVAGAGGVGGAHALTLARSGIGRFKVVDPDRFELANMNRQLGALVHSLGRPKAATIAEMIAATNPTAQTLAIEEPFSSVNAQRILDGVDVIVDGLDFFAIDARIDLYQAARARRIPVVTSGPFGMSATLHVFVPGSMSFVEYFDLQPHHDYLDKLAGFLVGVAPKATHRAYMDLRRIGRENQHGPSLGAACMLCAGVASIEVLRLVLGRPGLQPAPCFYQFDAYEHRLVAGRLRWGNRGLLQRAKRRKAREMLATYLAGR